VTLLQPAWLWALLGLPLLLLVRPHVRVAWHVPARALVLALLIVALARPALWTRDAREHAVFVLDASASVEPGQRDKALAAARAAVGALPAVTPTVLVALGKVPDELARRFGRAEALAEGSSLSQALLRAGLAIPDGARGSIVLVSDGRSTDRRWGEGALALEERGIPVHVVPLAEASHAPRIAALRALRAPRAGHSVDLEVEVSGAGTSAHVAVTAREEKIGETDIALEDGRGRVRIAWEPKKPGFVTLAARAGDHTLERTFAVQDPLRGLYLGKRIVKGRDQLARLVGHGIELEGWESAAGKALPDLDRYDVVVVDDLPADSLSAEDRARIVEHVTARGLGLLASGGASAFGPGGWHKTDLERILPVECLQKEEKRDPSTTLALIIDTSGSMGGERIQLAKEVARLAMARLLPHDKVGIVEFYGNKHWAAPIQPASNMIDLARAINRMDAGGGTVIFPAIEEAYYAMQNVQTRYKHVLVLTDGGVESAPFEPLLRRMAEEGMTVSTVLIGSEAHSELLVDIANWGKGRFYAVVDRFNLPEILLKQPTSSRLPAYKPGRFPVVARGGTGWWGDAERTPPALAGYVETSLRKGAETLIELAEEHDPILATWRYGLGRVTALTTEPTGPGTESWRDWSGYAPLLGRVLTRTADDGRARFRFTLTRRGEELELIAERRGPDGRRPLARRVDAQGHDVAVAEWSERAPVVFRARWTESPAAEVRVLAGCEGDPNEPVHRLCSSAREDELDELAVHGTVAIDFGALAAATGGDRVGLDALAGLRPRAGGPSDPPRLCDLTPLCLVLALCAYLLEIFHRRRDRRPAN
jgi:Mg-chelatase subunit ChlD